jgi:hypothetical protein
MADMRYFSGDTRLESIRYIGRDAYGIDPNSPPTFDKIAAKWVGYVKAERVIEYKPRPSRHECDSRCINATGRVMKCECSCGGKNHGRGSITCSAA